MKLINKISLIKSTLIKLTNLFKINPKMLSCKFQHLIREEKLRKLRYLELYKNMGKQF